MADPPLTPSSVNADHVQYRSTCKIAESFGTRENPRAGRPCPRGALAAVHGSPSRGLPRVIPRPASRAAEVPASETTVVPWFCSRVAPSSAAFQPHVLVGHDANPRAGRNFLPATERLLVAPRREHRTAQHVAGDRLIEGRGSVLAQDVLDVQALEQADPRTRRIVKCGGAKVGKASLAARQFESGSLASSGRSTSPVTRRLRITSA